MSEPTPLAASEAYEVVLETPAIDDYRRLRLIAGMTPRSAQAAAAGLPNTLAGVVVRERKTGSAVGMGRLIGDGGLFFAIHDIAVDPAHQGRGLGKAIMSALMSRLRQIAPAEANVSLIADGEAWRLYRQFGFERAEPSVGMEQWVG